MSLFKESFQFNLAEDEVWGQKMSQREEDGPDPLGELILHPLAALLEADDPAYAQNFKDNLRTGESIVIDFIYDDSITEPVIQGFIGHCSVVAYMPVMPFDPMGHDLIGFVRDPVSISINSAGVPGSCLIHLRTELPLPNKLLALQRQIQNITEMIRDRDGLVTFLSEKLNSDSIISHIRSHAGFEWVESVELVPDNFYHSYSARQEGVLASLTGCTDIGCREGCTKSHGRIKRDTEVSTKALIILDTMRSQAWCTCPP